VTDYGGGRVVIDVVGDTKNFTRDLQAKVDAAVSGVHAHVKVGDAGHAAVVPVEPELAHGAEERLRTKIEAAEARLTSRSKAAIVNLELNNTSAAELNAKVRAAIDTADAGSEIHVKAKVADGSYERIRFELARYQELARAHDLTIKVDIDRSKTDEAKNGFESLIGVVDKTGGVFLGLAGGGLPGIAMLAGMTGAIGPLIGALGGLVAGIAPAIGALAAIPAAVGVAGGAMLSLKLGIGDALKGAGALESAQKTAGTSAQSNANAQRSAAQAVVSANQAVQSAEQRLRDTTITNAEQIKAAKQTLANAQQQASLNQVSAIRNMQNAEYAYAATTRQVRDAVIALDRARQDAARNLQDQANAAKDADLSAQQAQLALKQAQLNAAQVAGNPNSTALQIAEANLAVEEAQQHLTEAQLAAQRAAADNTKAQKAGVDGNAQVKSATQQLADAQHSQRLQEVGLADLRAANARQAVADTRSIANAQQSLGDTYRTTSEASASAVQAVANSQQSLANAIRSQQQQSSAYALTTTNALKGLDAQQQAFARTVVAFHDGPLKQLKKAAADALLPGLGDALRTLGQPGGLFSALGSVVTSTGGALGDMARQGATLLSSGPFHRDLTTIGKNNVGIINSVGAGLRYVLDAARSLAVAGAPLVQFFADTFRDGAKHLDTWVQKARGTGALTKFFEQVQHTLTDLGHILRDVTVGISHFFGAGIPSGTGLLDSLAKAAAHFRALTGTPEAQAKFAKFFADTAGAARALGTAFTTLVADFSKISGANAGALTGILQGLAKALPALSVALSGFGSGAGGGASVISSLFGLLGKASGASGILGDVVGGLLKFGGALAGIAAVAKLSGLLSIGRFLFSLGGEEGKIAKVAAAFTTLREALFGVAAAEGVVAKEGLLQAIATKIMTAAQWAFNVAMDANPVTLVIIAIIALAVGLYELYKHSSAVRAVFNAIGGFLKDVFLGAVHAVGTAFSFVTHHLKLFGEVLLLTLGPLGLIIDVFLNWNKIGPIVGKVLDTVIGFFTTMPGKIMGAIVGLLGSIVDFFGGLFSAVGSAVLSGLVSIVKFYAGLPLRIITAILHLDRMIVEFLARVFVSAGKAVVQGIVAVVGFFLALPGKVIGAVARLGSDLANSALSFLTSMGSALERGVGRVLGFFTSLPQRMLNGLGNIGKTMLDVGTNIVQGIWNGISNAGGAFGKFVEKWVKDHIPGPIQALLKMFSPSQVMADMGVNIVEGLAQGIDAHGPRAADASRTVAQKVAAAAANVQQPVLHVGDVAGGGTTMRRTVGGTARNTLEGLRSKASLMTAGMSAQAQQAIELLLAEGAVKVYVDGVERPASIHSTLRRANLPGNPPMAPRTVVHA
jgi:hypothetical protein